ncbi:MAG: methylated-DNA--[protein]-cysteine S-methyltransferase [Anaerovoracaceae bacterium]|jgi:methylated-DNA-[protein]-cysteine S-methyltransferase
MSKIFYYEYDISGFKIGIGEKDGHITHIIFPKEEELPSINFEMEETPLLKETSKQLEEYFQGSRKEFSLPLNPIGGTPFMRKVWAALQEIPYGETRSYKDIAVSVGSPKACRAVGMANNRNPISIVVPCHRVIGSSGSLIGYGGGLDLKAFLLDLERNKK